MTNRGATMGDTYNAAAWLLDRHVDAGDGQRVAVVCGGVTATYIDVQRDGWRAQHALRDLDARRGERVAMVVNDEPAFLAWFLGGLRSGVVPVPLSTMLTGDDLAAIVADAGAGVVVLSAPSRVTFPACDSCGSTSSRTDASHPGVGFIRKRCWPPLTAFPAGNRCSVNASRNSVLDSFGILRRASTIPRPACPRT